MCVCVWVVNRHGSLLFALIKKLLGAKGHTPVNHRPEPGSLSQTGSKKWGCAINRVQDKNNFSGDGAKHI